MPCRKCFLIRDQQMRAEQEREHGDAANEQRTDEIGAMPRDVGLRVLIR